MIESKPHSQWKSFTRNALEERDYMVKKLIETLNKRGVPKELAKQRVNEMLEEFQRVSRRKTAKEQNERLRR